MMPGDTPPAAAVQSEFLRDPRVSYAWDEKRALGDLLAPRLELDRTAWDVYLVYQRGIRWDRSGPPRPTLWMHQLWGADPALHLDSDRLLREVQRLILATPMPLPAP